MTITADTLVVSGEIEANGNNGAYGGSNNSGAGSGGGILIHAGVVLGGGHIEVSGGNSLTANNQSGGSGGGGRIAIYYDTMTLPTTNLYANGGNDGYHGGAGTIYLKDNAQDNGDLIIDNRGVQAGLYTRSMSALSTFRSITVRNFAWLRLLSGDLSSVTVERPVLLNANGQLRVSTGVTLTVTNSTGFDAILSGGSTLTLDAGSVLNVDALQVGGGILNTNVDLAFPSGSDFELSSGGTVNVFNNTTLSLGSFDGTNVKSGTLNVPIGSRLNVATNSITLASGATLVKGGSFGVSGDELSGLTIQPGGIVTHAAGDTAGLVLNVTGVLEVQGGTTPGMIEGNYRGLSGGANGQRGQTFGAGDSIVPGAQGGGAGAGGSYGGPGGRGQHGSLTNEAYGVLENPRHVGSGGGGGGDSNTGARGGNGGGRVRITAGTLLVTGKIRANGENGSYGSGPNSGAGSGGSVLIQAGSVTIASSGTIEAAGGNARTENNNVSGSGGGGRIAIYYDTLNLPNQNALVTNLQVYGGFVGIWAGAGTVYLKDNAQTEGDLIVNNSQVGAGLYTRLLTGLAVFRSLAVWNSGWLNLLGTDVAMVSIEQPVTISGNATLKVASAVTLQVTNGVGFDLSVLSGSTLTLDAGSVLSANAVQVGGGTLNANVDLAFPSGSDFELSSGGAVNVVNNTTFSLGSFDGTNVKSGTLSIAAGSRLNVLTNSVVVANGVALVKDGSFGATGDELGSMTILSGGKVMHAVRNTGGLVLSLGTTLTIQGGGTPGMIDVNERGLLGGNRGSPVPSIGLRGETFDGAGNIVPGSGGAGAAAGASYGGPGANGRHSEATNVAYGVLENPVWLGSGGGGASGASNFPQGGNGGGRVTITAGSVVVDGLIRANGGNGAYGAGPNSAAGSGGSILIHAASVTGTGEIQAIGGVGRFENNNETGSGGGGRIAIHYDTMTLPNAKVKAYGGSHQFDAYLGGAGTIYLKDNAEANGDLIVDNGGVASGLYTRLMMALTELRSVTVGRRAILSVDPSHSLLNWLEVLRLNDGVLAASDTLTVNGLAMEGSGSIAADLRIAGSFRLADVGTVLTVSGLACTDSSRLVFASGCVSGSWAVPRVTVGSLASLGGVASLDGVVCSPGSSTKKMLMTGNPLIGSVLSETLADSTLSVGVAGGILYAFQDGATDVRAVPLNRVILAAPGGSTPFKVKVTGDDGVPVTGASNVWLDLSSVVGLTACLSLPTVVFPDSPSDGNGELSFTLAARGATHDLVSVRTPHGVFATLPIRCFDRNGSGSVTMFDYVGDFGNDYNDDGSVDFRDYDIFYTALGTTCAPSDVDYTQLEVHTEPGPESIFEGDTIRVVANVTNGIAAEAVLDSVAFETAGWGIAQLWTRLSTMNAVPLAGSQTILLEQPFVVPITGHGCFRVRVFPRYIHTTVTTSERLLAGAPRGAAAESLVYGVKEEAGVTWCYLASSSGQEFVSMILDPTAQRPIAGTLHLLGMSASELARRAELETEQIASLAHSALAESTAAAWLRGFPDFIGPVWQRDALVLASQVYAVFGRFSLDWKDEGSPAAYRQTSTGATVCGFSGPSPPNGCGGAGWNGYIVPDFDFTDCCNTHDNCYGQGGGGWNRLGCDADLAKCIIEKNIVIDSISRAFLGGAYFLAVRAFGGCFYNYDESSPRRFERDVQINRDSRRRPEPRSGPFVRLQSRGERYAASASPGAIPLGETTVLIPIGSAQGDSLLTATWKTLPVGWTAIVSDSVEVHAGDTVSVRIEHPAFVACGDTARVSIYAYRRDEEFAGQADVLVYATGQRGDLNGDGVADANDLDLLVDYLAGFEGQMPVSDAWDVDNDTYLDLADAGALARQVGESLPPACGPIGPKPMANLRYSVAEPGLVTIECDRPIIGVKCTAIGGLTVDSTYWPTTSWMSAVRARGDTVAVFVLSRTTDRTQPAQTPVSLGYGQPGGIIGVDAITVDGFVVQGVYDATTSIEFEARGAEFKDGHVIVRWWTSRSYSSYSVNRKENDSDWERLSVIAASESGVLEYTDYAVVPGRHYRYRLGIYEGGDEEFLGELSIDLEAPRLELLGMRPNPGVGDFLVGLSLPGTVPARLDLFDARGRRVAEVPLRQLGPGRHDVRVSSRGLASGVYWLRLRAGREQRIVRAVLVK